MRSVRFLNSEFSEIMNRIGCKVVSKLLSCSGHSNWGRHGIIGDDRIDSRWTGIEKCCLKFLRAKRDRCRVVQVANEVERRHDITSAHCRPRVLRPVSSAPLFIRQPDQRRMFRQQIFFRCRSTANRIRSRVTLQRRLIRSSLLSSLPLFHSSSTSFSLDFLLPFSFPACFLIFFFIISLLLPP